MDWKEVTTLAIAIIVVQFVLSMVLGAVGTALKPNDTAADY